MHVGLNLNLLLMARFLNFMIGPVKKKQVAPEYAQSAKGKQLDEDDGGHAHAGQDGSTRDDGVKP